MSIWKDLNGSLHDDMDGQAVHMLPSGCVKISAEEAAVLFAPPAKTTAEIASEYEMALERHVDSVARAGTGLLTFKNSESAVSYTDDTDPAVAAASQAFKVWRSAFWAAATVIKVDVLAGSRTMPTVEEAIAELPKMVWPAI